MAVNGESGENSENKSNYDGQDEITLSLGILFF